MNNKNSFWKCVKSVLSCVCLSYDGREGTIDIKITPSTLNTRNSLPPLAERLHSEDCDTDEGGDDDEQ